LNRLSTANVDREIGKVVYTQWLNDQGGIEADLTVTRTDIDKFLIVTSVSSHTHDLSYLKQSIGSLENCTVTDMTSGMSLLGMMGPHSRALLQELSGADLSNEKFAFGTSQEIEIGYAICRANRITYVGALGWELYIPTEFSLYVYEQILSIGSRFGLKLAGMHALNACRLEKGYRHWGHDIGTEDSPLEAGLSFTCDWDKPGGFVGDRALSRQRELGLPRKRLVQFKLKQPDEILIHEEPIFANGQPVGVITSGMYGHRVGASLGMGYVHLDAPITAETIGAMAFEIGIGDRLIQAEAQLTPWYDPKGLLIKV
jgi:4-methylaminobutanoate oxidase (formaldehyde-forming)